MTIRRHGFQMLDQQPCSPARLPARGRYLLLSDLHLGDGGRSDAFGQRDDVLVDLLDAHAGRIDALVLGGDVLDAIQARTPERIRQAHPRALARLRSLADQTNVLHVMGNHDDREFVHHLLPGANVCSGVSIGEDVQVIHGHEFDYHFYDGPLAGRGHLAFRAHAFVERLTGQPIRLPFAHYPNFSNRFAHWVFYRLTMVSLLVAAGWARMGRGEPLRRWAAHHDYWARSQWGDSQAMLLPALAALAAGRCRVLIVGHSHQAGLIDRFTARPCEDVSGAPTVAWRTARQRAPAPDQLRNKVFANLGAWTSGASPYGLWERGRLRLHDWGTGRSIGDRSYRLALEAPAIPGMRTWWRRYYRGLLRYDLQAVLRDLAPVL